MASNTPTIPGIYFSEIDNTIRPNAAPGDGVGAIVMNSNRGVPNQRVLCTTIDKFHEYFGTPDDVNQYGHFAARAYFEHGGAKQLLAVRATQGDEGYAQIQYPYTDSVDKEEDVETQRISFVDNDLANNLNLIQVISPDDITAEVADSEGFDEDSEGLEARFSLRAPSKVQEVDDIFQFERGNDTRNRYVFRATDFVDVSTSATSGAAFRLYTDVPRAGIKINPTLVAVVSEGPTLHVRNGSETPEGSYFFQSSGHSFTSSGGEVQTRSTETYYETVVHLDAADTLNHRSTNFTLYTEEISSSAVSMNDIITNSWNQSAGPGYFDAFRALGVQLVDWDDGLTKDFVVPLDDDNIYGIPGWNPDPVYGFRFTEYGTADSKYVLVKNTPTAKLGTEASDAELRDVADDYGVEVADIANDRYAIVKYTPAKSDEEVTVLAYVKSQYESGSEGVETISGAGLCYEYTWVLFKEKNSKKIRIASTYGATVPDSVIKPWQVGFDNSSTNPNEVSKMTAISSIEVFSDPSGRWKDGYTPSCKNDGEPGNGDIELYQSSKSDQLIIGAIGPGEFGNDVGISIITPEAATIPALYGPYAFSWLYRYDDEDKIASDPDGLDYRSNTLNLTWKKVYKINVYVKAKSKTQAVWGFGLDALMSSPVESFLVSNDPTVKDENGNSLWAPYVINGNSQYIYVSKKSVESAANSRGGFSLPEMTWSIYQMTGGSNSKLNNVKEKTKALDLYKNRKKAYFNYLFNVEPIETFSGKQKYMAMQNRIGEIATNRKMDVGIIQCTSKEAKTIRLKMSEAKMFNFPDGSYVAGYDDYDSYFDPFTSNYVMLPKSVAGAVACCYTDLYDRPWNAAAGIPNGIIRYSNETMTDLDDDELAQLFGINVNYSQHITGYGEVLMAQRTMLKLESALNSLDIRRLCNFIETRLENKLLPFLYKKNTATNRSAMRTSVDTFLGRIQSGQGIISRTVEVIPDQKNPKIVYVTISFVPAESIEQINVTLVLNRETGTISPLESITNL